MPDISTFVFTDWKKSDTFTKRLRVGTMGTPFDTTHHVVYAYLHGDGNNRIGLTQGAQHDPVFLVDADEIELDKPFWYLCINGRLFREDEKGRFRALLCFLFFAAGQVGTLKSYSSFEDHLVNACTWYGGALMIAAEAKLVDESESTGSICASGGTSQPIPEQPESVLPSIEHKKCKADTQKTEKESQCKMTACTDFNAVKRSRLAEAVLDMRRKNTEQSANIAILERELTNLSKTIKDSTESEAKVAAQAAKISDLTEVIQLQRTKLNFQRAELEELSKLKAEVGRLQDAAGEEKQGREEEQRRRIEAERKLKDCVDAQKKIAARFG
ncbi:hypothetical protein N0V94_009039 [Neodidymelliopsis sp. IMI 364377]|nr:hypothetical protein N0V94_009039 [Neodidymelliopsis sp. IMI 364377]